jgi:hypothetical protein
VKCTFFENLKMGIKNKAKKTIVFEDPWRRGGGER